MGRYESRVDRAVESAKQALPANALGYTATHYFSSEASSRVVTDRPDDEFLSNVKIAWAESGAQSLMGTHISGDWARALLGWVPEDDSISLCARTLHSMRRT